MKHCYVCVGEDNGDSFYDTSPWSVAHTSPTTLTYFLMGQIGEEGFFI